MKTKKIKSLKKVLTFVALLFFAQTVHSQQELTKFLNSSLDDGNKLMEAWASPFLKASGVNLNNSWYVSAEPLKSGRFEIRLIGMASFAPEKDKSFDVTSLGLSGSMQPIGTITETPTIFGDKDGDAASFAISAPNPNGGAPIPLDTMMSPLGTGLSFLPGFTPQLSVGIYKGTEVMVRWLPKIEIGDFKRTGFGVGIKHEILQWIPAAKELPISVSFIGTYAKSDLSMTSEMVSPDPNLPNDANPPDYTTQSLEFSNSGWSAGLAISKKLPIITFFGGLHFTSSKSTLGLYGPYPLALPNSSTGAIETNNVVDPIDLEAKHNQFSINGGMRLKIGIMHLTLSGNYAPGGYSSATLAWGIGWFN
ncbi:MAG: hypothetical protein K9J13_02510 [Saprospiraceae bacterium]|nr:hypothetical protein [Saprospiraceae bacterium]